MKTNCLQAPVRFNPRASALISGLVLLVLASTTSAQNSIRDYRRAHERQILAEFTRLLTIPNIAADQTNIRRNAQFILEMMQRRGLSPRLLETKSKATSPAVYGEWKTPAAT